MDQNNNAHRLALAQQAVETLNCYTDFHSDYQVTFALAQPDEKGLPRIAARFTRFDGVPFAESAAALDKKFTHLKDQTVALRTFFFPMMKAEFDEAEANQFDVVDFDYAAILGYGKDGDGNYILKALYLPPTDAFLTGHKPDEDGVWRSIRVPTYHMHRLSLDPRKTFTRHLYLAERFSEGLEYQYDKFGFFYSNPEG